MNRQPRATVEALVRRLVHEVTQMEKKTVRDPWSTLRDQVQKTWSLESR